MNMLWKNKNFLLLFLGRSITNIGDSLYYVATMWLVYKLGGSTLYSGIAGFLILLPMSLQFMVGPLVDRWSTKKTLVVSQLIQMLLISIIPFAYLLGFLTVQLILIVVPFASFIEQFANPAETKSLPMILNKSELLKGNSLFSFAYKGIDMISNSIGGVLILVIGAIALYIADTITFAITTVLFSLLSLPVTFKPSIEKEKKPSIKIKNYFSELKEGFSIVKVSLLKVFLLGSIICNFALGISMAVLPAFSHLKGGADIYGFFLAAESIGVLLGALSASWIGRFKVGYFTIISFTIGAVSWGFAGLISSTFGSILLFGLAWLPIGATNILLGSVSQSVIPNHLLGRVSSVIVSISVIAMPLGSLLGGYLASEINSGIVFTIAGSGLSVISIVWLVHPKLRKLPIAKDINQTTFDFHYNNEDTEIFEKGT